RGSGGASRSRQGVFGPKTEALFDLVSAGEMLAVLVPGGRLPHDFAARCLRHARARREVLAIERAALEAGARIAGASGRVGTGEHAPLDASDAARLARLARRY